MNLTRLLVPIRAVVLCFGVGLGVLAACSSGNGDDDGSSSGGPRICAPGTNVVCRCVNGQVGTKPCNDDGTGYAAECSVDGTGLCPGGELPSSSSGGSSSGSQSGGRERCEGERVAVTAAAPTEFTASTKSASDDLSGEGNCAAGNGAADQVFMVVPATRGTLKVEVIPVSGDYAPVAYLRRGSCGDGAQVGCAAAAAGEPTSFEYKVVKDESYWLVIDGAAGPNAKGDYRVKLTLTEGKFCGDGVADPGEVCDDANNVDGDGCDADCKGFSGNPTSAIQCPGQPIHLWPNTIAEGTGSTAAAKLIGAQNNFSYLSQLCSFGDATTNNTTEHVYDLVAHADGELEILLSDLSFNARMSLWTACAPSDESKLETCANEFACGDSACQHNAPGASLTLPRDGDPPLRLQNGKHYTLVVDGNNDTGDYSLLIDFSP